MVRCMMLGGVLALGFATGIPPSHAEVCPTATAPGTGRELAHPVLTGSVGPYERAVLVLTRRAGPAEAPFAGALDIGDGRCLWLQEPDEPTDFFLIRVKAAFFTPLDGGKRANGIVVLYDSSQIGPQHGTDHEALVYRVDREAITRDPAIEQRLLGTRTAAEVRQRLARVRFR